MVTYDQQELSYMITTLKRDAETENIMEEKKKTLRERVTNNLAVERLVAGVSQQELADRLGTSKSSISRIEHGGQNITLDYVSAYAEALGKEVSFSVHEPPVEYGDKSTYYLRLYDEKLAEFSIERSADLYHLLWVNEDKKHLLPLDLELSDEGMRHWLEKRTIPKNREMVGDIMRSLGLKMQDTKGILDIGFGLSLNDSYWTPQADFEGSFGEYNLYENEFTSALSLVAYTGNYIDVREKFRTSPELTTNGMLRKGWKFFGKGDIWLYKGGTFGFANTGNEPYSEFYASQIAERMGLNAVKYELENWMGILASKCRLFTDIDTSFIPIGRIVRTGGINACLDYYRELGDEFYQQLADMLVFDAVIINEDRHYGNFGLLRDNRTGRIIAPAPVFDNGLSLLCYAMKDDFDKLDKYIEDRSNPYGWDKDFMSLARRVMGPRQRAMLRRLINFRFEDSDVANPPAWRKQALEQLVQKRMQELLKD